MLIRYLTLLALLTLDVVADVKFVTPAPGASIAGGGKTLSVSWAESGEDPPLASLTTYTLFLCAGGNDAASQVRDQDEFHINFSILPQFLLRSLLSLPCATL